MLAFIAIVSAAIALAGCAAMRAPIDFEPIEAASDAPPAAARLLHIEAVEGRPNGLVLRFWCEREIGQDVWLEVLRKRDGEPTEQLRSLRLDERLRARLVGGGFEFLDRSVRAAATTAYKVRLRASEGDAPGQTIAVSEPLEIAWQTPPASPQQVQTSSEVSGVVELRWQAPANFGALIFRRDVLDANARTERLIRLGPQARGTFVDRDVAPGGVYAYQVALAIDAGTTVQFGPPSEEIYVTVRAVP